MIKQVKHSGAGHTNITNNKPQEYILMQTLIDNISMFKRIGLKVPSRQEIGEIEQELFLSIKSAFDGSNVKVETISFDDLCDEIACNVNKQKVADPNVVVLTTAPLLGLETGGNCIEVNRLVDFFGEIISVGARPGHASVARQLAELHHKIHDQSVVIVEDGSFTGKTLLSIIKILREHRAYVKAILLGVIFPEAEKAIREVFDGEISCCKKLSNPLDWMPSHDFFPFIPNSGRVVGIRINGSNGNSIGYPYPLYLPNHASLCIPYIRPYGKPNEWASIPCDMHKINAFSALCLMMIESIYKKMEALNGKEILLGDIIHSYPMTGIPISCGDMQTDYTEPSERVLDIIHQDRELLN